MTETLLTVHVPILLEPIVKTMEEAFAKEPAPAWMIDCTLGGGGHTGALLKRLPERHRVLSIDQDAEAIARARLTFADEIARGRLLLVHDRFSALTPERFSELVPGGRCMGLMADLGFSSDQLEAGDRGLSFLREGPLDMRLDPSRGVSAYQYLHNASETQIADLLWEYGEERFSRRIASSIQLAKRSGTLPNTTTGLADLIYRAVPPPARHGRIHAATRSFQALRIAVNAELEELDLLLTRVILNVRAGGRIAILSFHSLEDRKVKQAFRADERFQVLTKKPIEADDDEIRLNPRSRSAKLRMAERIDP